MLRAGVPLAWALLGLAAAGPAPAEPFPVLGGYGFDWLQPKTSRCHRISEEELQRFERCQFHPQGNAFGLPLTYHSCEAAGRSETLIYATAAQCEEAFRTMEANAP